MTDRHGSDMGNETMHQRLSLVSRGHSPVEGHGHADKSFNTMCSVPTRKTVYGERMTGMTA